MTPEQCAEFLGIKINTLYVMKSQGRIPTAKWATYCASTLMRLSNGQRTMRNEVWSGRQAQVLFVKPLWLQPPNGGDVL